MLISISFCYLILTDILFALALGAARFYRTPEETITYPEYLRRILRHSRPFLGLGNYRRHARNVRKTRHYFLYIACSLCLLGATYAALHDEAVYYMIPVLFAGILLQAMCYVDLRTRYLPDIFMLPALLFSLIIAGYGMYLPTVPALIGGAAGFGIMWGINALFRLIRKKDGMGGGDFMLTGLLGLWTGAWAIPYIMFLSSFAGLAGACLYALCMRKGMPERFAFGPALALAGWGIFLAMQTPAGRDFFLP